MFHDINIIKYFISCYLQLLQKRIKENKQGNMKAPGVSSGLEHNSSFFLFLFSCFNLPFHWDLLSNSPLNSLFLPYNPVIMVPTPSHAPSSELYFGTLTFLILFLRSTALSSPRTLQPSAAISLCCGERSRIDQYEGN